MATYFEHCGYKFEVLDGEYRSYPLDMGFHADFFCLAKYGDNRILVHYIDTKNKSVDYTNIVFENIPGHVFEYLIDVLSKETNILVHASYVSVDGCVSKVDIYYDCDCSSNCIDDLLVWTFDHNDFEAETSRFTEIRNGHRKSIDQQGMSTKITDSIPLDVQ